MRPIRIQRRFTDAPGSVLIEMGRTRVLCTASLENGVPPWRKDSGLGWVTAEYTMLPGATTPRKPRARLNHTDSRGVEIQRLIGRTLRNVVDFARLGENVITVDCDVLQADGGTRCAAINGGYLALVDAIQTGLKNKQIPQDPLLGAVAAISVGIVDGKATLDLDYDLDSRAMVDMNVAMTDGGKFVEIQGTGEQAPFDQEALTEMLDLAKKGIRQVLTLQAQALGRKITIRK